MAEPTKPYTSRANTSFNQLAAGNKVYNGIGIGSSAPTVGPVDKTGYKERDAQTRGKRNALLRRMKAQNSGSYISPAWLGGTPRA